VPPGVAPPTAAEMVQVVVPAVPPPAVPMNMNVMNPMAQVNYQVYYPPYAFANEYAPAEGAHQTNPTADAAYSQDNGVADVPSG